MITAIEWLEAHADELNNIKDEAGIRELLLKASKDPRLLSGTNWDSRPTEKEVIMAICQVFNKPFTLEYKLGMTTKGKPFFDLNLYNEYDTLLRVTSFTNRALTANLFPFTGKSDGEIRAALISYLTNNLDLPKSLVYEVVSKATLIRS
jgi:hypothetical protein